MDKRGDIEAYDGAPMEAFNIAPLTPGEQEKRKKEDAEEFKNTARTDEPIWDPRNQDWD